MEGHGNYFIIVTRTLSERGFLKFANDVVGYSAVVIKSPTIGSISNESAVTSCGTIQEKVCKTSPVGRADDIIRLECGTSGPIVVVNQFKEMRLAH